MKHDVGYLQIPYCVVFANEHMIDRRECVPVELAQRKLAHPVANSSGLVDTKERLSLERGSATADVFT